MSIEAEVATVSEEVLGSEQGELEGEEEIIENEENDDNGEDTETEDADEEDGADGEDPGGDDEDDADGQERDVKKNANERIRELVERSKVAERELLELKAQFEADKAKRAEEVKPFIEVDMNRVEADIASMYERIDELKMEGHYVEAAKIQKQIVSIMDAVETNEIKKAEWEAKQNEKKSSETVVETRIKEVADAAEFYRKSKAIPEDVWDTSGKWLQEKFASDPLLGRKFAELVDRQGSIAAIEWAHKYTVENMGKGAKEVKEKKEQAKKKIVGGTTSTGTTTKTLNTFDDLMALSSAEIIELEKTNPRKFNALINQRLKN